MEYSQYPEASDASIEIESIYPLPPAAVDDTIDFPQQQLGGANEVPREEIRERNNRSGKGLYAVMTVVAVLAASALAVATTLLVQNNRSIDSAEQSAIPPPLPPPFSPPAGASVPTPATNTFPPSFRGTNRSATTSAPTVNGTQENIPLYEGDDESTSASNLTEAGSILDGTLSNGTTTGIIGATENVTVEVGVPTQSPVGSFIPLDTYSPTMIVNVFTEVPAPTPELTDEVDTPEPTDAVTAQPTPGPTGMVTTVLDTPSPTDAVATVETLGPTEGNTTSVTAPPTPEPTEMVTTVLDTPSPTEAVATVETLGPTEGNTTSVTAPPTPEPTEMVTTVLDTPSPTEAVATVETLGPTEGNTTSVTATPTPEPTEIVTTAVLSPVPSEAGTTVDTPEPTEVITTELNTNTSTPPTSDSLWPGNSSSCVNIKFTSSKDFPKDNGFTFLSTESGEVIGEEKAGFMTEPQTEYLRQFCNLSSGSYTLVVTDTGKDGMYADGQGSYIVDIDGQVVLVGGRFRTEEISHEILVGFNTIMSETEQEFLDVHNSRRQDFHESQDVSFRPMAWSAELAAGASAWAREKAKTCTNDGHETGKYGQNTSTQRIVRLDVARSPERIVNSWFNKFDPEQSVWNNNLKAGTAVLWRTALYVGCATEIGPIENCAETEPCLCQVTNCRYSRTTNCAVQQNNWIASVIDENGQLCNSVFCPGADENGNIVEGACHV